MKTSTLILMMLLLFACSAVKKVPPNEESGHPYCLGPIKEFPSEEIRRYLVMIDLSDTATRCFLPLHSNSLFVAHSKDSIKALNMYLQNIEYPKLWKELGIQGSSFYRIHIDEQGIIQSIDPLRTIEKKDPIFP
jgi:hypothetical protein